MGKQLGLVIDISNCVGCQACEVACKQANQEVTMLHISRLKVLDVVEGVFPEVRRHFVPVGCNHCRKPACVAACPVQAISRSSDGVVMIDEGGCTGCGACVSACPYGHVQLDQRNIAVKCQLCRHLIGQGREPGCVSACTAKMHQWAAIHFGDLGDPGSEVSKMVEKGGGEVLNPEYGTEPQHSYLNLPRVPIGKGTGHF